MTLLQLLGHLLEETPEALAPVLEDIDAYSDEGAHVGTHFNVSAGSRGVRPWRVKNVAEACERLEARGYFPTRFFEDSRRGFEAQAVCPRCNGGGFEGWGEGYSAVCDDCAGNARWTYREPLPPDFRTLLGWARRGPTAILQIEEAARECRHVLREWGCAPNAPYTEHVIWRWGTWRTYGDAPCYRPPQGWPETFELMLTGKADYPAVCQKYAALEPLEGGVRVRMELWRAPGGNPYRPLLAVVEGGSWIARIDPGHTFLLTGGVPDGMFSPHRGDPAPWREGWSP